MILTFLKKLIKANEFSRMLDREEEKIEKNRIKSKLYYWQNRDRILAYKKQYYQNKKKLRGTNLVALKQQGL